MDTRIDTSAAVKESLCANSRNSSRLETGTFRTWNARVRWRLPRPSPEGCQEAEVEPSEIQARAAIAAALITSHAVEIPTIPTSGDWSQDTAALRLRDLTDYVYQMITTPMTP
jgi:hypothetical protein